MVQVLERQQVPLPATHNISRVHRRLLAAVSAAGFPNALTTRGGRLFAGDVVGVIDAGDVIVEVLPKTSDGVDANTARDYLFKWLRFVDEDAPTISPAHISAGGSDFFETLYRWAVEASGRAAETGLPRRYTPLAETGTSVRGRIDLKRLVLARPGRQHEITVHHAPLISDNRVSQLLKWMLREIARRTVRSDTYQSAQRLLSQWSGVAEREPSSLALDDLHLSAFEAHWQPLVHFALNLARQETPSPLRAGELPSVAVLFTLHDLFERALRRVFKEAKPAVLKLSKSVTPPYLFQSVSDGAQVQRLRPDFSFTTGKTRAVGDAKWKRILRPPIVSLGESDAFQLVTYMVAANTDLGFVFCPLERAEGGGLVGHSLKIVGTERLLHVIGIHLPTLFSETDGPPLGLELQQRVATAMGAQLDAAAQPVAS